MRLSWAFLLALASASASSLLEVTDKTFQDVVINSGKFTLVDFYADWCRHCMKLMPTIEELAELYKDIPGIQIVKIDGDDDGRKMTKKYKVPGFPTLLMFNGENKPVEFEGIRDLDSISNFVQTVSGIKLEEPEQDFEFTGPSQIVKINDDNFQDLVLRANHKTLVAFTAPWCKHSQKLSPIFSKLANHIFAEDGEIVKFAEADLSDENKAQVAKIVAQFGVSLMPTILLFDPSKVDDDGLRRPVPYTADRSLDSLLGFVNENTGLDRNSNGELNSNAGRIQHLEQALREVSAETEHEFSSSVASLKRKVQELGRNSLIANEELSFKDDVAMLPYYSKLAVKIASGDLEFLSRELARLERILTKNTRDVERSARDYMQKRVNILKAYFKK